jgi:hypothetical protein
MHHAKHSISSDLDPTQRSRTISPDPSHNTTGTKAQRAQERLLLKQISHFLSEQQDTLVEDSLLQLEDNDFLVGVSHRKDLTDSLFDD